MKKISLKASEFKTKKLALADTIGDKEYFTKDEVISYLNDIYGMVMEVYGIAMSRDDGIVDATNNYIEEHAEGHMPVMDKSQVKAVLTKAGIADEFEEIKTPLEQYPQTIWATLPKSEKEELGALKITVK